MNSDPSAASIEGGTERTTGLGSAVTDERVQAEVLQGALLAASMSWSGKMEKPYFTFLRSHQRQLKSLTNGVALVENGNLFIGLRMPPSVSVHLWEEPSVRNCKTSWAHGTVVLDETILAGSVLCELPTNEVARTLHKGGRVVISGYGVGGAAAALKTIELLHTFEKEAQSGQIKCITFGSPGLGRGVDAYLAQQQWSSTIENYLVPHDIIFSPTFCSGYEYCGTIVFSHSSDAGESVSVIPAAVFNANVGSIPKQLKFLYDFAPGCGMLKVVYKHSKTLSKTLAESHYLEKWRQFLHQGSALFAEFGLSSYVTVMERAIRTLSAGPSIDHSPGMRVPSVSSTSWETTMGVGQEGIPAVEIEAGVALEAALEMCWLGEVSRLPLVRVAPRVVERGYCFEVFHYMNHYVVSCVNALPMWYICFQKVCEAEKWDTVKTMLKAIKRGPRLVPPSDIMVANELTSMCERLGSRAREENRSITFTGIELGGHVARLCKEECQKLESQARCVTFGNEMDCTRPQLLLNGSNDNDIHFFRRNRPLLFLFLSDDDTRIEVKHLGSCYVLPGANDSNTSCFAERVGETNPLESVEALCGGNKSMYAFTRQSVSSHIAFLIESSTSADRTSRKAGLSHPSRDWVPILRQLLPVHNTNGNDDSSELLHCLQSRCTPVPLIENHSFTYADIQFSDLYDERVSLLTTKSVLLSELDSTLRALQLSIDLTTIVHWKHHDVPFVKSLVGEVVQVGTTYDDLQVRLRRIKLVRSDNAQLLYINLKKGFVQFNGATPHETTGLLLSSSTLMKCNALYVPLQGTSLQRLLEEVKFPRDSQVTAHFVTETDTGTRAEGDSQNTSTKQKRLTASELSFYVTTTDTSYKYCLKRVLGRVGEAAYWYYQCNVLLVNADPVVLMEHLEVISNVMSALDPGAVESNSAIHVVVADDHYILPRMAKVSKFAGAKLQCGFAIDETPICFSFCWKSSAADQSASHKDSIAASDEVITEGLKVQLDRFSLHFTSNDLSCTLHEFEVGVPLYYACCSRGIAECFVPDWESIQSHPELAKWIEVEEDNECWYFLFGYDTHCRTFCPVFGYRGSKSCNIFLEFAVRYEEQDNDGRLVHAMCGLESPFWYKNHPHVVETVQTPLPSSALQQTLPLMREIATLFLEGCTTVVTENLSWYSLLETCFKLKMSVWCSDFKKFVELELVESSMNTSGGVLIADKLKDCCTAYGRVWYLFPDRSEKVHHHHSYFPPFSVVKPSSAGSGDGPVETVCMMFKGGEGLNESGAPLTWQQRFKKFKYALPWVDEETKLIVDATRAAHHRVKLLHIQVHKGELFPKLIEIVIAGPASEESDGETNPVRKLNSTMHYQDGKGWTINITGITCRKLKRLSEFVLDPLKIPLCRTFFDLPLAQKKNLLVTEFACIKKDANCAMSTRLTYGKNSSPELQIEADLADPETWSLKVEGTATLERTIKLISTLHHDESYSKEILSLSLSLKGKLEGSQMEGKYTKDGSKVLHTYILLSHGKLPFIQRVSMVYEPFVFLNLLCGSGVVVVTCAKPGSSSEISHSPYCVHLVSPDDVDAGSTESALLTILAASFTNFPLNIRVFKELFRGYTVTYQAEVPVRIRETPEVSNSHCSIRWLGTRIDSNENEWEVVWVADGQYKFLSVRCKGIAIEDTLQEFDISYWFSSLKLDRYRWCEAPKSSEVAKTLPSYLAGMGEYQNAQKVFDVGGYSSPGHWLLHGEAVFSTNPVAQVLGLAGGDRKECLIQNVDDVLFVEIPMDQMISMDEGYFTASPSSIRIDASSLSFVGNMSIGGSGGSYVHFRGKFEAVLDADGTPSISITKNEEALGKGVFQPLCGMSPMGMLSLMETCMISKFTLVGEVKFPEVVASWTLAGVLRSTWRQNPLLSRGFLRSSGSSGGFSYCVCAENVTLSNIARLLIGVPCSKWLDSAFPSISHAGVLVHHGSDELSTKDLEHCGSEDAVALLIEASRRAANRTPPLPPDVLFQSGDIGYAIGGVMQWVGLKIKLIGGHFSTSNTSDVVPREEIHFTLQFESDELKLGNFVVGRFGGINRSEDVDFTLETKNRSGYFSLQQKLTLLPTIFTGESIEGLVEFRIGLPDCCESSSLVATNRRSCGHFLLSVAGIRIYDDGLNGILARGLLRISFLTSYPVLKAKLTLTEYGREGFLVQLMENLIKEHLNEIFDSISADLKRHAKSLDGVKKLFLVVTTVALVLNEALKRGVNLILSIVMWFAKCCFLVRCIRIGGEVDTFHAEARVNAFFEMTFAAAMVRGSLSLPLTSLLPNLAKEIAYMMYSGAPGKRSDYSLEDYYEEEDDFTDDEGNDSMRGRHPPSYFPSWKSLGVTEVAFSCPEDKKRMMKNISKLNKQRRKMEDFIARSETSAATDDGDEHDKHARKGLKEEGDKEDCKQHACIYCGFKCYSLDEVGIHQEACVSNMTNELSFLCPACNTVIKDKMPVEHNSECTGMQRCDYCGRTMPMKDLEDHRGQCNQVKSREVCQECGESFPSNTAHSCRLPQKEETCLKCGKRFPLGCSGVGHRCRQHCEKCRKEIHPEKSIYEHLDQDCTHVDFSCSACKTTTKADRVTKVSKVRETHRLTCSAELSSCKWCGAAFETSLLWTLHEKICKYKRETCNAEDCKGFKLADADFFEENQPCPMCDFQALNSLELHEHLRSKCEQFFVGCPFRCGEAHVLSQLTEHVRMKCTNCSIPCASCPDKLYVNTADACKKKELLHHLHNCFSLPCFCCGEKEVKCRYVWDDDISGDTKEGSDDTTTMTIGKHLRRCFLARDCIQFPCPFCKKSIGRMSLEEHITQSCSKFIIRCPFSSFDTEGDCKELVVLSAIGEHVGSCNSCKCSCVFSGCPAYEELMTREELQNHYLNKCRHFTVVCSFQGCLSNRYPKMDEAEHMKRYHTQRTVHCESSSSNYADIGYGTNLARYTFLSRARLSSSVNSVRHLALKERCESGLQERTHLEEEFECPCCGYIMPQSMKLTHLGYECEGTLASCPLGCGFRSSANGMVHHITAQCPLSITSCAFCRKTSHEAIPWNRKDVCEDKSMRSALEDAAGLALKCSDNLVPNTMMIEKLSSCLTAKHNHGEASNVDSTYNMFYNCLAELASSRRENSGLTSEKIPFYKRFENLHLSQCSQINGHCQHCGFAFDKTKIADHEAECPKKKDFMLCSYCQRSITGSLIDHVLLHCKSSAFDVMCPFECGMKLNFRDIYQHSVLQCSSSQLSCLCSGECAEGQSLLTSETLLEHLVRCPQQTSWCIQCHDCNNNSVPLLDYFSGFHTISECTKFKLRCPIELASSTSEAECTELYWPQFIDHFLATEGQTACPAAIVKCREKCEGSVCGMPVPMKFIDHHLLHECEYHLMEKCENSEYGCNAVRCPHYHFYGHVNHSDRCEHDPIRCPGCLALYSKNTEHECSRIKATCIACGTDVAQSERNSHLSSCPELIIKAHHSTRDHNLVPSQHNVVYGHYASFPHRGEVSSNLGVAAACGAAFALFTPVLGFVTAGLAMATLPTTWSCCGKDSSTSDCCVGFCRAQGCGATVRPGSRGVCGSPSSESTGFCHKCLNTRTKRWFESNECILKCQYCDRTVEESQLQACVRIACSMCPAEARMDNTQSTNAHRDTGCAEIANRALATRGYIITRSVKWFKLPDILNVAEYFTEETPAPLD